MINIEKIRLLKKIIEKAKSIKNEDSDDSDFKMWKKLVERTLIRIYGKDSLEIEHFSQLSFYYEAGVYSFDTDYSSEHLRCFRHDMRLLLNSINEYIEELSESELEQIPEVSHQNIPNEITKIFISHSSKDVKIVEEIIEILETIGVESNQIFCTSFEGYGIGLGDNFLDVIRDELSSESLVLFILSSNFYKSPVSMCEMGATWILSKEHIPIIIPPLSFEDIKGVIPSTQGLIITETMKLNSLKDKIEKVFKIQSPLSFSTWERKRDRIVKRIDEILSNQI